MPLRLWLEKYNEQLPCHGWSSLLWKWLFNPNFFYYSCLCECLVSHLKWDTASLYKSCAHSYLVLLISGFSDADTSEGNRWYFPGTHPKASWHKCRLFLFQTDKARDGVLLTTEVKSWNKLIFQKRLLPNLLYEDTLFI